MTVRKAFTRNFKRLLVEKGYTMKGFAEESGFMDFIFPKRISPACLRELNAVSNTKKQLSSRDGSTFSENRRETDSARRPSQWS